MLMKLRFALIAASLLLAVGRAGGAGMQSAQAVMTNLTNGAHAPRSFEADTSLQLKQRSFPFTRVALSGTSYFQAPNRLIVKFSNVPGYMRALPQAYSKILNVGGWRDQYDATLLSPQSLNGHTDYVLQLTPKSQSGDRGVAYVNPADWTVERVVWNLSGGVQLTVSEDYTDMGSYRLPSNQEVSIHTPYATADGNVTLQNYALNVPIDSAVFTR
jgi:outer membrane lipoprotein-sorting protein